MTAFTYDHDDEARTGRLTVDASRLDANEREGSWQPWWVDRNGNLTVELSQDEAIALYELLRSHWAGYVAERDESAAAVRASVPLATFLEGWKTDTLQPWRCRYQDCCEGHPVASDEELVTCPTCRAHMGLEPAEDMSDFGYALDDPKHPTYHDRMVD